MPLQVCREWEATALKVNKDVRLALIRIGVVLGKDGGALGKTKLSMCSPSLYTFTNVEVINVNILSFSFFK